MGSVIFIYDICFLIAVSIKRLHDLGHSGGLLLLIFIPFANVILFLYLILIRGHVGDNKYGESLLREDKPQINILDTDKISDMFNDKREYGKVLFVLLIVFLMSIMFYWFQWRPGEIRKKCEVFANKNTKDIRPIADTPKVANNFYRSCLVKNGMRPESLFVNVQ